MRRILILMALIGCLLPSAGFTWDNHYKLTKTITSGLPFLDKYASIEVTPMTYTMNDINSSYTFPFKEGEPGTITDAKSILVTYSDEPDWGMDQNLRLSWQQKFMGGYEGVGSQGYIHCYYPAGSFNLPVIAMPMGMTPKRIAQVSELVEEAIAKGDLYWAFRFSAWIVHYLEDMGMPYHTTQTTKLFYWTKDGVKGLISGTTTVTGNYHFAYEAFADHYLTKEIKRKGEHGLREALLSGEIIDSPSPSCLCKKAARKSHKVSSSAFKASKAFFPGALYSSEDIDATEEDFEATGEGNSKEELLSTIRSGFSIAGSGVKTWLTHADAMISRNLSQKREQFEKLHNIK